MRAWPVPDRHGPSVAVCREKGELDVNIDDDSTMDNPSNVGSPLENWGIDFKFGGDEAGVMPVGDTC